MSVEYYFAYYTSLSQGSQAAFMSLKIGARVYALMLTHYKLLL